jgi:hypothetical protein
VQNFDFMTMNKTTSFLISAASCVILFSGCDRLGNGVVQEIDFPTHTPQLAVTLISKSYTDTLVARAHTSAGILDTTGSRKLKNALFTLSQEDGISFTWGGENDWTNGIGHILTDVNLESGLWTLRCEEDNFETATATQLVPPQIDSAGSYAYAMSTSFDLQEISEYGEAPEIKYYVERRWSLDLSLPDRLIERDFFIMKTRQPNSGEQENEEEEVIWDNSTYLDPEIEDDSRVQYNRLADGFLIEDVSGVNSLSSVRFIVNQYLSGPDLELLLETPAFIELAALSPELASYYQSLDMIANPSGGGLFTEPLLAYSNMSSGYGCFGLYTSCLLELTGE